VNFQGLKARGLSFLKDETLRRPAAAGLVLG